MRTKLAILLMLVAAAMGQTPSPYSNITFKPATVLTAASQTGTAIPVGKAYSVGTVNVTASSLTTATIQVLGSVNGTDYFALPLAACSSTSTTTATTATVTTAPACYQFSMATWNYIELGSTSGTFTATSVTLTLTASPNAQQIAGRGGGGGATTNPLTGAASGGAAPGTTFDGSVARTFDYHTFGAVPTLSTANCLAAVAPVQSPCQAYYQAFTGLGNGGGTGTITLYSSNAPSGAVFLACQHIWINTPAAGGEIYAFPAYTTPGGSTVAAAVPLQTTSAVPNFSTFGNSCFTFALGTNSSFTYNNVESGVATGVVWETEIVVARIN